MTTPVVIVPTEPEPPTAAEPEPAAAAAEVAAEEAAAAAELATAAAESSAAMTSSPASAEIASLERLVRLQKETLDLVIRKSDQQWESVIAPLVEEMRSALDEIRACVELVSREIGRGDELVQRMGTGIAALARLEEHHQAREAAQAAAESQHQH